MVVYGCISCDRPLLFNNQIASWERPVCADCLSKMVVARKSGKMLPVLPRNDL